MRKWMLGVLALTMVGLTFDTAEAGGRRGRGYRSYSSYSGYSGSGYSSSPTTQVYYVNAAGQLVPINTSPEYTPAHRGEVVSPAVTNPGATSPVQQTSYQVPTNGTPVSGSAPTSTPVYQTVPMSYPMYAPSTGFGFGGNCVGGG